MLCQRCLGSFSFVCFYFISHKDLCLPSFCINMSTQQLPLAESHALTRTCLPQTLPPILEICTYAFSIGKRILWPKFVLLLRALSIACLLLWFSQSQSMSILSHTSAKDLRSLGQCPHVVYMTASHPAEQGQPGLHSERVSQKEKKEEEGGWERGGRVGGRGKREEGRRGRGGSNQKDLKKKVMSVPKNRSS